jgi:SPP1 family predicted phage head-tail adaptor
MPSLKSSLGNNEYISLDDVCFLISYTTVKDELGQLIEEQEIERQIFCSELSVSRAEFSAAGQHNRIPQCTIVVDSDEYDQERTVKHDNKKFTVYRTFMRSDGLTELYCEVRAGG